MAFSAGVCSASFCQHPECWKASIQTAREAVRLRNGIKCERGSGLNGVLDQEKWNIESSDEPLPTLKVIDAFGDADLGSHYANSSSRLTKSSSFQTYSHKRQQRSKSLGFHTLAPRPTPTSPTVTDYQKHMSWKQTMPTNKASAVGVFELFDEEEMQQDWRDIFITSAYLVWCPSSKEKNEKMKRVSSSKSDSVVEQMKKVLPKDLTETMMPSTLESSRPVKPKSSKKPSGGQPYSPNRTPQRNYIHIEHLDLAKYGLTDLPRPVLAGILRQLQPSQPEENKEREEEKLNKENEDKIFEGKENGKEQPTGGSDERVQALVSEEGSAGKDTHKLVNVDIGSQFKNLDKEGDETERKIEGQESLSTKKDNVIKHEVICVKQEICEGPVEKPPLKRGRQPLLVSSVGIPAEYLPKIKGHHCVRSIPNYHFKAAMEPVNVVPGTFSPSVTPPSEVAFSKFQRSVNSFPSLYLDTHSGQGLNFDRNKGHLTSALGLSPVPLRVPAPTPNSPDKISGYFRRQYLRSSHSSASDRRYSYRKRNEDQTGQQRSLRFSFSDVEQRWEPRSAGRRTESLREPSLQIPLEQDAFTPKTQESGYRVFLTEEAAVRCDPAVTPVHSCSDFGDWPKSGEVINIIEPEHLTTRHSRGFKGNTYVPLELVKVENDSSLQKNYIVSQKVPKRFNALPESTRVEEHAKCMVITEGGMSAPSWRPPRSRTPIHFLSTPSKSAPKPLKQPSVESVPRSLSVQRLEVSSIKRTKSTPFREKIPDVDPQVHPVLSDSSLNPELKQQCSVDASRVKSETGGSFPPPPSPEVQNDATSGFLDTLNEEDEHSSVASSFSEGVAVISDVVRPSPLGEEDGKNSLIKSSMVSSEDEIVFDTVQSQANVIAGTKEVENEVNTKTKEAEVGIDAKET